MAIDRAAAAPVHVQVQDELRALIDVGEFEPGAQLPTELALADRFGVNRLTIREALGGLRRSGLVIPRQGVGTFVARQFPAFDVELTAADWAVEHERAGKAAADQGHVVVESLVDAAWVEAPPSVAEQIGPGRVLWLESLHAMDGDPAIRSQYWLRTSDTLDQVQARAAQGLDARVLGDIVGTDMYYAWRSFDAAAASRHDAALLNIAPGAPLLRRCGLNTNAVGQPLLYVQRDAPSGRMRIVLRSQAEPVSDSGR